MQKQIMDYQIDEEFKIYMLLKNVDRRITKNGKDYLAIQFQDRSGIVRGNYWDVKPSESEIYKNGAVVLLHGKKELYHNTPQIKIISLELVTEGDNSNPELYVPKAPMSQDDLKAEFSKIVFEINNPDWNRVVRYLLKKYDNEFFTFPAAKSNHHAFERGLAYHTLSIVRLAQSVGKQYSQINMSLLLAGAILHDLGKTIELSGPVATTYTLPGNLIGHIVLVDEEIVQAAEKLKIDINSESMILLRHMILSHHGLNEYGSPVVPHILEAVVLHDLDEMDAQIQMVSEAVNKTEPGKFSERVFGMDNHNFFNHS